MIYDAICLVSGCCAATRGKLEMRHRLKRSRGSDDILVDRTVCILNGNSVQTADKIIV